MRHDGACTVSLLPVTMPKYKVQELVQNMEGYASGQSGDCKSSLFNMHRSIWCGSGKLRFRPECMAEMMALL